MTDICSTQSNDRIKQTGQKKADLTAVLIVFKQSISPMTAREVHHLLENVGGYKISLNSVRSRITEATSDGVLKKDGRRIGGQLDKFGAVNTWSFVGGSRVPKEQKWECCDRCHGRGRVPTMRDVDAKQGDFIR